MSLLKKVKKKATLYVGRPGERHARSITDDQGRGKLLGERFRAAVKKRTRRRKNEWAGRKAARR